MAFSGKLTFNPLTDSLLTEDGKSFKFSGPQGEQLPKNGFTPGKDTFIPPSEGVLFITLYFFFFFSISISFYYSYSRVILQ